MAKAWKQPVTVFAGRHGNVRWLVSDTEKAAEILLDQWPVRGGAKHIAARKACLRCLAGDCDPEQARQAFIEAAREADILAE